MRTTPRSNASPEASARSNDLDAHLVWDAGRLAQHLVNAITILALSPEWRGVFSWNRDIKAVVLSRWTLPELLVEQLPPHVLPSPRLAVDTPGSESTGFLVALVSAALARTWGLLLPLDEVHQAVRVVAMANASETQGERACRELEAQRRAQEAVARPERQERIARGSASRADFILEERALYADWRASGADPADYRPTYGEGVPGSVPAPTYTR